MAKSRTTYLCSVCGNTQSQWMGKCPDCGAWDALEKFTPPAAGEDASRKLAGAWTAEAGGAGSPAAAVARPLAEIEPATVTRMPSGIGELDRVLGGGFVPGSVTLLGGDPGIGKSTLLLQAAGQLARSGRRVLYVSSEESAFQTRLRAERLFGEFAGDGAPVATEPLANLLVLAETSLDRIAEQASKVRPDLLVLDSIQMVATSRAEGAPGTVAQLRRCCTEVVGLAKVSGMAVVLVGHVTKDGQLAGPRLLEHLVDAVLAFEGDRYHAHRVVRGVKNRFGSTQEVGLFEMAGDGLSEIDDPAGLLDGQDAPRPGAVACPVLHGSRALVLEIQALTATGFLGSAKRRSSGLDGNRLAMLIAVLEQVAGLRLADQDVFASVAGGIKVVDPATDLALLMAIAGAHRRQAIAPRVAVVGEVGLGGEVRRVAQLELRVREARRAGHRSIIVPAAGADEGAADVTPVRTVREALEHLGA